MIMPKEQAMGDVLTESPKGGPHPLANGLQRFKPRSLLGCMDTQTLRRAMIHRDKDGHLPVLAGVCRRHGGPPHRIDLPRDDGPIMGLWAMWLALPRGGQEMMRTPQTQD